MKEDFDWRQIAIKYQEQLSAEREKNEQLLGKMAMMAEALEVAERNNPDKVLMTTFNKALSAAQPEVSAYMLAHDNEMRIELLKQIKTDLTDNKIVIDAAYLDSGIKLFELRSQSAKKED